MVVYIQPPTFGHFLCSAAPSEDFLRCPGGTGDVKLALGGDTSGGFSNRSGSLSMDAEVTKIYIKMLKFCTVAVMLSFPPCPERQKIDFRSTSGDPPPQPSIHRGLQNPQNRLHFLVESSQLHLFCVQRLAGYKHNFCLFSPQIHTKGCFQTNFGFH